MDQSEGDRPTADKIIFSLVADADVILLPLWLRVTVEGSLAHPCQPDGLVNVTLDHNVVKPELREGHAEPDEAE